MTFVECEIDMIHMEDILKTITTSYRWPIVVDFVIRDAIVIDGKHPERDYFTILEFIMRVEHKNIGQ